MREGGKERGDRDESSDGGTGNKEVHICEYERDRQIERGEEGEGERDIERRERERGGLPNYTECI